MWCTQSESETENQMSGFGKQVSACLPKDFTAPILCPIPTPAELLPATSMDLERRGWPAVCSTNTWFPFSSFRVRLSRQLVVFCLGTHSFCEEAPTSATLYSKASNTLLLVSLVGPWGPLLLLRCFPVCQHLFKKAHLYPATWPAYHSVCGPAVTAD